MEGVSVDSVALQPRTPLTELPPAALTAAPDSAARVILQPAPFVGQVAVRGHLADAVFASATTAVLGLELPASAGGVAESEPHRAIWLGPDHWLVVTVEGEGPALSQRLRDAFGDVHAAAVDVSGARTRLRLAGEGLAELLAEGCSFPFGADGLAIGKAVQTMVGNAAAVIHHVPGEVATADLYVPRSQAMSFWAWLETVCGPYGVGRGYSSPPMR